MIALTFMASLFQNVSQAPPPVATETEEHLPAVQVRQVRVNSPVDSSELNEKKQIRLPVEEHNLPDNNIIDPRDFTPLYGQDMVCTIVWRASPEEGDPPTWLSTPDSPEGLYTDIPYTYLAGALIQNEVVDASHCANNGLLPNGAADTCGLEAARAFVTEWQNQFNEPIYYFAKANAIPAVLLKRVFALESQFWIGVSSDGYHAGLGHTTPVGLDPLFLFYPAYYDTLCPYLFSPKTCEGSYSDLSQEEKAMMRGFLYNTKIDASCPTCPYGVDSEKTTASIDIFAKLVISNCHQTNQLFINITDAYAGSLAVYEDLWKFTMANYNVGSGCMSEAYSKTYLQELEFNWGNVSGNLEGNCENAVNYVDRISY